MKYKDVLNDLFDLLDRHRMIKRWGYGNLSDLVNPLSVADPTQEDGTMSRTIDYPYAFLNPTNHTITKGKSTFRFNLIVMDQCTDSTYEVIETQSDAHEYIKDILAEIYYNFDQKYDFTLNSNLTPFKEKYNDTVSGMTANIELEIRDVLDDCIAPFAPKYDNLFIYVANPGPYVMDGEAPGAFLSARDYFINTANGDSIAYWDRTKLETGSLGWTGKVELTYNMTLVPGTGDTMPSPLSFAGTGGDEIIGWPTEYSTDEFSVTQIWNKAVVPPNKEYLFVLLNKAGTEYDISLTNIQIKFYS
jgi:hypothetical protein